MFNHTHVIIVIVITTIGVHGTRIHMANWVMTGP